MDRLIVGPERHRQRLIRTAPCDSAQAMEFAICAVAVGADILCRDDGTDAQGAGQAEETGVLGRYAIGGAMGATFYAEPLLTFDLDVFVVLPQTPGGLLTLTSLYDALRKRGYAEEGECVNVEGVPVQFLPAYNALLEEALGEAQETVYEATPTRVLRAEHLLAIALQTGREKDRHRVRLLLDQATINMAYLSNVLSRHGLESKWNQWKP